jgi:hypothetical protein
MILAFYVKYFLEVDFIHNVGIEKQGAISLVYSKPFICSTYDYQFETASISLFFFPMIC